MAGTYKIIDVEVRNYIIKQFNSGMKMSKIAEELKLNRRQVRKVLVENGLYEVITHKNKKELLLENREFIISLYEEGLSTKKIKYKLEEKGLTVDLRVIRKFLIECGYDIKSAKDYNKKFTSDSSSFSEYDLESCYWGGVIASDGCVFNHGTVNCECNYFSLGVSQSDIDMVEKLKKYVKYDGKLYIRKRSKENHQDCVDLRVNNREIVKNLEKNFNITKAKSLTYIPPNIPQDYKKYFILGLLDGDGCITYCVTNTGRKHFSLSYVGTKETCEYILDFFNSNVKLHKRHKDSDNNNFSFVIQGNVQIYKILSSIYDDQIIKTCLERKYNKFLELEEQINSTYYKNIQ